jgi:LmbE family N-acetylglucosaminyl deacetylase
MMHRYLLLLLALFLTLGTLCGQASSSGDIQAAIDKLAHFRRVLYIAAHPDDENTKAISWFSRGRHAHTAYLSLTRGDGGQNLIGPELGPNLGLIRTYELMAAREIDGGQQFFTRAVDFGYSKTAEESLNIWGHRDILHDVVYVIRKFKPDVIVTRFPPDKRAGHGHHTASALLALEAFDLAADPNAFPEHLRTLDVHQVQAVYWNTSRWWVAGLDTVAPVNPDLFAADIGGYSPVLGINFNELGSLARSQHKSQGFGVSIERGRTLEYFERLKGKAFDSDFWEAEEMTWEAFAGPSAAALMEAILSEYNPRMPHASLESLVALRKSVAGLPDNFWKHVKIEEIDNLIWHCAGLFADARSDAWFQTPGAPLEIEVQMLARNPISVHWKSMKCQGAHAATNQVLETNIRAIHRMESTVPKEITTPYWLKKPFKGRYDVSDAAYLETPINRPTLEVQVNFDLLGESFSRMLPVRHVWSDRVHGEQQRELLVTPTATATFDATTYVFTSEKPVTIGVKVKAFQKRYNGKLRLDLPSGWHAVPKEHLLSMTDPLEERTLFFEVTPPKQADLIAVKPILNNLPEGTSVRSFTELAYEHLPLLNHFPEASASFVRVVANIRPGKVAYIHGAGDEVDRGLMQMGFEVDILNEKGLAQANLNDYIAVVMGIRAYNTNHWLTFYHDKLLKFVENGGNLIVQYNTATRDLVDAPIGPYPFRIARDRVTEENAKATILNPEHPIWHKPNHIGQTDFDGWVQERGLYFADEWAPEMKTLISWHDQDEPPRAGGLLFARYGKGSFVYTGISFFRQIPAGVPGAFKILANIVSYEQP